MLNTIYENFFINSILQNMQKSFSKIKKKSQ